MGAKWSNDLEIISSPIKSIEWIAGNDKDALEAYRHRKCERDSKVGVGIVLVSWEGEPRLFVNKIQRHSPAEVSGQVAMWDELLSVDGIAVDGLSGPTVCGMVRGPVGSHVTLSLRRGGCDSGHVYTVELLRECSPAEVGKDLFFMFPVELPVSLSDTKMGVDFIEVPPHILAAAPGTRTTPTYGGRAFLYI